MSNYRAPLADMRFVLNELAGLGDVAGLPGCEEATPELVVYDEQGRPETVKYHLLGTMLLNELQKEHARNEVRDTEVALDESRD